MFWMANLTEELMFGCNEGPASELELKEARDVWKCLTFYAVATQGSV